MTWRELNTDTCVADPQKEGMAEGEWGCGPLALGSEEDLDAVEGKKGRGH